MIKRTKLKLDKLLVDAFVEKVNIFESDKCIPWEGNIEMLGYGIMFLRMNGKTKHIKAHRVSYLIHNGELKGKKVIDHICRNRACVNPKHLRQVSQRKNVLENSNSIGALNFLKVKCAKGHLLKGNNLLKLKNNSRKCRICWNIYQNNYKRKKA